MREKIFIFDQCILFMAWTCNITMIKFVRCTLQYWVSGMYWMSFKGPLLAHWSLVPGCAPLHNKLFLHHVSPTAFPATPCSKLHRGLFCVQYEKILSLDFFTLMLWLRDWKIWGMLEGLRGCIFECIPPLGSVRIQSIAGQEDWTRSWWPNRGWESPSSTTIY